MNKLRIGFIGLGQRGASFGMTDGSIGLLGNVLNNPNAVVSAICDRFDDRLDFAEQRVLKAGQYKPKRTNHYEEIIDKKYVDAIIVSTSWDNHVVVSLKCMEMGIPIAMEVGGTHNIDDCWKLVNSYEKTHTPFMFLENCCFGEDEMLATSLVRNGILGDISFCQGAYCHDLREEIVGGIDTHHYRLKEYMEHNCENYPTHELGPIAKLLNINTGNKFDYLVSMSSKAQGLHTYIMNNEKYRDRLFDAKFSQGDVVTTMIKCANGETILLKLDTSLPRLYERGLTVSGTKGFYCQTTQSVILDDGKYNHELNSYKDAFFNQNEYKKYLPSYWQNITEAQLKSGHGGIDYIMLKTFVDCIIENKPMPIDIYDAVAWMSITALSEQSIAKGCIPVKCPDFTMDKYKNRKIVDVLELPKISK